jgi:hypothetical protein
MLTPEEAKLSQFTKYLLLGDGPRNASDRHGQEKQPDELKRDFHILDFAERTWNKNVPGLHYPERGSIVTSPFVEVLKR